MDVKTFVRANADRVFAIALLLLGAAAVVIGWFGVSGTGLAAEQIPYLVSGGIGGIMLVVVACTAWVSADLQDDWRRLDAIEEQLERIASTRSNEEHPVGPGDQNGDSPARRPRPAVAEELPS